MPETTINFDSAYCEALKFLKPYLTSSFATQASAANPAIGGTSRNFVSYFERSLLRYQKIFPWIQKEQTWLDIGGLFSALPIALALCGLKVTVAERLEFYPKEMGEFFEIIQKTFGISVLDIDFSVPQKLEKDFDCISLMSVIEHIPHSPRFILENIHSNLKTKGHFFLDVPNLHYSSTILRFLQGKHIQAPIETVYNSRIPYAGHFREYNRNDLTYVLQKAGFKVIELDFFNYSNDLRLKHFFRPWGWPIVLSQLRPLREMIFAICDKAGN